jgi:hypothetical protein
MLEAGQLPPWAERTTVRQLGGQLAAPAQVSGAALLAISAGLTVANLLAARSFKDPDSGDDLLTLEAKRTRTNLLGGLAVGAGAMGGGLFVAGTVLR